MLSHFPKITRTNKLLRFLANKCYGLAAEIERSTVEAVSKDWQPIIDNLTDDQLKAGCEWVKEHGEPFIKPIRFRFLAHSLIDPDQAYEQAKERIYRHPAIKLAANKAEIYRDTGTDEQVYQKFRRSYAHICDKIIRGEELPNPTEKVAPRRSQTPGKPKTEAQKSHCREEINKMREKLGFPPIITNEREL